MVGAAKKIEEIIYPISDGEPMADGDKQWKWIVRIKLGFEAVFQNQEVYVTGDTFWYPVQGDNEERKAPDVMIAFDRPQGDRGAYLQWEENNIAPKVVFEIWSPSNFEPEMKKKRIWYLKYGVEEYYEYDPFRVRLRGWRKENDQFKEIKPMHGWVSPLTKVRFELHPADVENELRLFDPNNKPFLTYMELLQKRNEAEQVQLRAEQSREQEAQARIDAEKRARLLVQERDAAKLAQLEAEQKLEALLAKLKSEGIDV
jgi:Uma2 family endonuclease